MQLQQLLCILRDFGTGSELTACEDIVLLTEFYIGMPIQAPQWTDYLSCPICCREFGAPPRSPISLSCGHTFCKHCIKHLHRKQCPYDQAVIQVEPDELVINTALLQLAGLTPPSQPYHPPCIRVLAEQDKDAYDVIVRCMEHLAVYLKYCSTGNNSVVGSRLSRPMQRKLVTLLQCPITDEEGRGKAARAARSLGERTVTELILQHQNPQQLSANLWAAVRARGCQFLGPAMQEEVLKLVLLALEDGSALSRKVLVMFVVQRLEPHFPQASKTSIGHVVQLLYRASCFKVSKRECDSSLMQLKEEFRSYDSLRREHDAQIVQIATEAGLRIAPDQWSALLYGDTAHKSHMQSIIDKLQSPQSFAQSVQELFIALQRTGDAAQLLLMSKHLDRLANIDSSLDVKCPSWQELAEIMTSLKEVVTGLIHYLQQQITNRDANHNQKHNLESSTSESIHTPSISEPSKFDNFNMPICPDSLMRILCPRGVSCPMVHVNDDYDPYRVMPMDARNTDQHHNFPNTSNTIPNTRNLTQNTFQGIPDNMPSGTSPLIPQGVPQPIPHGSSQTIPQVVSERASQGYSMITPRAITRNMQQEQETQRLNVTSPSPGMRGVPNNVRFVLPSALPVLYPQYTIQGPLRNSNTPVVILQPCYPVPTPFTENNNPGGYRPVLVHGSDLPRIIIYRDPNMHMYPRYEYQNSANPGSSVLSPNENVQQDNASQYPSVSRMFPFDEQMHPYRDVPENADIILDTPSYVPMAFDMKPEAPWSPANRNNSSNTGNNNNNFNATDNFNAAGSDKICKCNICFRDENSNGTLPALASNNSNYVSHENITEDNRAVGANRNIINIVRANYRRDDNDGDAENITEDNRAVGANRNIINIVRANYRRDDNDGDAENITEVTKVVGANRNKINVVRPTRRRDDNNGDGEANTSLTWY